MLQIVYNQAGHSAGVAGVAREDLALGVPVVATASGGTGTYSWRLGDAPPNDAMTVMSTAALSASAGSSVSVTPDNQGTYRLICTSGSETVALTFYAGDALSADPTQLPQREPAFGEETEHNVPDGMSPTGNPKGWERAVRRWMKVVKHIRTRFLDKTGDSMSGVLGMGGNRITGVGDATTDDNAPNLGQVRNLVNSLIGLVTNTHSGTITAVGAANTLARSTGTGADWSAMTDAMHGQLTGGSDHEAVNGVKNGFATPGMWTAVNNIANTIAAALVGYFKADGSVAATGTWNLNGNEVTNAANGQGAQSLVTLTQLTQAISAAMPVRGNGRLIGGEATVSFLGLPADAVILTSDVPDGTRYGFVGEDPTLRTVNSFTVKSTSGQDNRPFSFAVFLPAQFGYFTVPDGALTDNQGRYAVDNQGRFAVGN